MYFGRNLHFLLTLIAVVNFIECKPSSYDRETEDYSLKHFSLKYKLGKHGFHHRERNNFEAEDLWKFRDLPDHTKYIAMARYLMHNAGWTSLATISSIPDVDGYPFPNIISIADGPIANSTGQPYFYLTPLDYTAKDLQHNNKCTMVVSLNQMDYCQQHQIDPEDPRCARVMLSGGITKIVNTTEEFIFATKAMKERHPNLIMPADHGFFLAKLNIKMIALLDWFGGPKYINVEDYFKFDYNELKNGASYENDVNIHVIQV